MDNLIEEIDVEDDHQHPKLSSTLKFILLWCFTNHISILSTLIHAWSCILEIASYNTTFDYILQVLHCCVCRWKVNRKHSIH